MILGAGLGTRLGNLTNGLPKVLLELGGEVLLDRNVRLIQSVFPEITRTIVVVGFRAENVIAAGGNCLTYVMNPSYERTNTAYSLFLALREFPEETILLNGDVFCDADAISPLRWIRAGAVCEFKAQVDAEEVQVKVDSLNSITRIGKNIGGVAEAVGIYRLSTAVVAAYLDAFSSENAANYYEDVINRMLEQRQFEFSAADLKQGSAIEIDTPADFLRAEQLALSTLQAA